jgi:hypothetical protein
VVPLDTPTVTFVAWCMDYNSPPPPLHYYSGCTKG